MVKTADIINIIENLAPVETSEEWDNTGWQINLHNSETKRVLSCLTVTEDVLNLALNLDCDLIISHHPLIFSAVKKLQNPIHIKAVQNGIQIYSAHTNFDKAPGGTSDILVEKLSLENVRAVNDYVKQGSLPFDIPLEKFIQVTKKSLELNHIKLINKLAKENVQKVAVCAGAGAEFINDLKDVDVYITSDIKYHSALDVKNMALLDIGHFESEKFFAQKIKDLIEPVGVEVIIANEKPAWTIV